MENEFPFLLFCDIFGILHGTFCACMPFAYRPSDIYHQHISGMNDVDPRYHLGT